MKWEEYKELATKLASWLRGATGLMLDRNFPTTLIEMKVHTQTSPDNDHVPLSELQTMHTPPCINYIHLWSQGQFQP